MCSGKHRQGNVQAELKHAAKELAKAEEALRCTRMAGMVVKLGQVLGRSLDFTNDAGSGAFADVAFARDSETGEEMAIKLAQVLCWLRA